MSSTKKNNQQHLARLIEVPPIFFKSYHILFNLKKKKKKDSLAFRRVEDGI